MRTSDEHGSTPCELRLRHPLECRPFRPERRPAWMPNRRDQRIVGRCTVEAPERRDVCLVADEKLGAVRINFRFAGFQSVSAAHSEKAGRDQYFEGPHETWGFRKDEIDPTRLDLQYQPARLESCNAAGRVLSTTFDWAVEMDDGRVVLGEDKADQAFFEDPDLAERLDFAEAFLERRGASLDRRVGGGLPSAMLQRVVKDIYDARRTDFDDAIVSRVQQSIRDAGGTARLGDVLSTVGHHPARSLDVVYAMMHRRHVSIPLSKPPMADTPVTIPRVARAGALRAFLAAHVPAPGPE